jgi:hypothetical protein
VSRRLRDEPEPDAIPESDRRLAEEIVVLLDRGQANLAFEGFLTLMKAAKARRKAERGTTHDR